MPIAIKTNNATRLRVLKERHPYLSAEDIHKLTRVPLSEVKGALSRRPARDVPKSRAQ
jgi:hypothetical protein